MYAREFRIDQVGRFGSHFTGEVSSDVLEYARAFQQLPADTIRFIFQDQIWQVFEFQNLSSADDSTVLVRFREIEPPFGITARELDVLTLVALGLSNQAIAARLGNKARTVSTQVETLLNKTGQESRTALAALAVEHGYIRLPLPGGSFPLLSVPIHVRLQNSVHSVSQQPLVQMSQIRLQPQPVTIGVVIPSGQAQSDGQELLQGAQLAVEEINKLVGEGRRRELRLLPFSADLFDSNSVRTAFASALSNDLDALITSYVATEELTLLEPVADAGIPFLHTATQYSQVERVEQNPMRYGNFFQTCPPETFYGQEFIDVLQNLTSSMKWVPPNQRFVSIELDTATTSITTEHLVDYAQSHGWSLAQHIRVKNTGVDWSEVVAKVAQQEPAVVLLTHFLPDELIDFYRAFLASGLKSLIMSVYGPSVMEFQEEFKHRANGIIWSTTSGTYADLLGNRFRNSFLKRFGKLPGWSQAGAAYDQIQLLTRAWQAAGTVDPKQTIKNLRSVAHRGVNGTYYLGERGQTSLAYPYITPDPSMGQAHMVYQIQNGMSRPLGPEPYGNVGTFIPPFWSVG